MRIAELLFGCPLVVMALWGLGTGEIFVIGGKAAAGEGGWASFGEHPVIFLLAFCVYAFAGIGLIRAGLKDD